MHDRRPASEAPHGVVDTFVDRISLTRCSGGGAEEREQVVNR